MTAAQLPLVLGVGVPTWRQACSPRSRRSAATITSLHWAAMIVWARIVLGGRTLPLQAVGRGFAALAIFLVAG